LICAFFRVIVHACASEDAEIMVRVRDTAPAEHYFK
jgi:hypothetical protein